MSNKIILALAGPSGSGKTALAEHLATQHGFYAFEGSTVIKASAAEVGEELVDREDYLRFYEARQRQLGKTWLVDAMLARPEPRLVDVGLRCRADVQRLHQAGGLVVALACPPQQCLERIDTTNPKNAQNIRQYTQHLALENGGNSDGYGLHLNWVLEHADVTIDTAGPLSHSTADIDTLVAQLA